MLSTPCLEWPRIANNVFISKLSFTEVDVNRLTRSRALEYVDLSDNPVPPRTHEELKKLSRPTVSVSEREKEDWEDLDL